ncbi:hypothetical protein K3495_g5599 [Podosphaera aphanis]|nr:hypothetical protein K3495_g5599 [Podosphaera aphanis]
MQGLSLANEIGQGTYYRAVMDYPSVLDLTLVTSWSERFIQDWQTITTGSDHEGIIFTILGQRHASTEDPHTIRGFNTNKADWNKFGKICQELFISTPTLSSSNLLRLSQKSTQELFSGDARLEKDLDQIGQDLTNVILAAAKKSIPRIKLGAKVKPWWSDNLKVLRKKMTKAQRAMIKDYEDISKKEEYLNARNLYFQEIKTAKKQHWNNFLEQEDPSSIFKALSYTKEKKTFQLPPLQKEDGNLVYGFQEKSNTLRTKLFPAPPESPPLDWSTHQEKDTWDWPLLTPEEVERACCYPSKGKAPGSDGINWKMIEHAYRANQSTFFQIYSLYFNIGYQPTCWREATGIILRKPGKPDYSHPKAYRVISLLNCLGKSLERMIAQRLGYLAETTNLLDPSQIGGRLKKSAVDACLLLQAKVEAEKTARRNTSTLFLDVKGAFDHVSKNQLLHIMSRLGLPVSLLSWVSTFLSNRQLRLSFDRQTEAFTNIKTGILQGSPISPILFLIYIRDMFRSKAIMFLSYIDDISLTVSSTSFKKNIQILEREVKILEVLGIQNAVQFDISKTELIHFANTKEAKQNPIYLTGGNQVKPSQVVRWLGVLFDSKLSFKQHVTMRVAQAKSAFHRMERLTNTERGLSPIAMRQLYLACVTSVSD